MAIDETRCSGCGRSLSVGPDGKPAPGGPKVVRIATGRMKDHAFEEKAEWGTLHVACFDRSIDSPEAVLAEVRRQSRQSA